MSRPTVATDASDLQHTIVDVEPPAAHTLSKPSMTLWTFLPKYARMGILLIVESPSSVICEGDFDH